jgi:hypothetical protein
MAGMADYLEAAIVNWSLRGTGMPAAPTPYLALFIADPADGAGVANECTYSGYLRTNVAGIFSAPSGGNNQTANNAQILCPINQSGVPVTVTHAAIFDAPNGGNMLWNGPLSPPKVLTPGDQIALAPLSIVITPDTL